MHQTPDPSFLARRGLGFDDVSMVCGTACVLSFGVDAVDLRFVDALLVDGLALRFLEVDFVVVSEVVAVAALASRASLRRRLLR